MSPGVNKITGFFDTWVKKNSVIGEELSKTFNYQRIYKTLDNGLGTFSVDIYAFDGEGETDWGRDESGSLLPHIRRVCTLKADLSGLQRSLKVQKGSKGQDFWRVEHSINVHFGGTALKARLTWYEGVSFSLFLSILVLISFRISCVKAPSASYQTRFIRSRPPSIKRW
jgi:hypothetical protein